MRVTRTVWVHLGLCGVVLAGCGQATSPTTTGDTGDSSATLAGDGAAVDAGGSPTGDGGGGSSADTYGTQVGDGETAIDAADAASTSQAWDLPGVPYTLQPGEPIAAPDEQWTFVPVPGAKCANGSATGMAVNLTKRSSRLVFYLQGGGACWEAAACAAGTATHVLDTMDAKAVLGEAQAAPMAAGKEKPIEPIPPLVRNRWPW